MLQVILDTDVIVSAARSNRGASAALLTMIGGAFELNLSVALALEYEEVLERHLPQVGLSFDAARELVAFLVANSNRREIASRVRPLLSDADDDFIADLACSFDCDYLVTHNLRHFQPLIGRGVGVVKPGEFLEIIRGRP